MGNKEMTLLIQILCSTTKLVTGICGTGKWRTGIWRTGIWRR